MSDLTTFAGMDPEWLIEHVRRMPGVAAELLINQAKQIEVLQQQVNTQKEIIEKLEMMIEMLKENPPY